jgi:general stress protein 26
MSKQDDIRKLQSLIRDIKFTMMTTAMPDGTLRSRPMATQRNEFEGTLWFFTDDHAAKVHEILEDTHVNLGYASPSKDDYVSVSGRATLVKDKGKAKELWNPMYEAWFPQGLDDPHLALIRVDIDQAECWDARTRRMVPLAGFANAVATT